MIDRRQVLASMIAVAALASLPGSLRAASGPALRVGSLKFGSFSWLLKAMQTQGIDESNDLDMSVLELASTGAARIALLSGDADVLITDWPWAMRQRSEGLPLRFAPYSSSLGSVMVPHGSPIASLMDLKGKRVGVAGSAIDKSWVLLKAYSRKVLGADIGEFAEPIFGAAPLITEQIRQGRVDAALNYWTYSARLAGEGYTELISMEGILSGLEIEPQPPLVGFVWNERATAGKEKELAAFLKAVKETNAVLASSDEAWEPLKPLMRVDSEGEFEALRRSYRSGIPQEWSPETTKSADKLMKLLIEAGEATLAGGNTRFDAKLFHGA